MNLKYIFTTAIALAACTFAIQASSIVDDMAQYVHPKNRPASASSITYMPDGKTYLKLSDDHRSIVRCDIESGEHVDVLVDLNNTRETTLPDIEGFAICADVSQVLVWRDSKPVYRRSFKASYYVYEVHSRLLRPLSKNFSHQEAPVFSPNGRMVAFVADNNIYIKKLDYQTEVAVTTDGKINNVINGTSDWTYEEEFYTTCSMTWAPDDLNLCFLKYNETEVPTYDMQSYCGACNPREQYKYYPGTWSYKYPMAGQVNSKVTLHSYDVETRKTKDIILPDNRIEYIPRVQYGPDENTLIVTTLNRDQNHFEIYKVNPKSTIVKSIYSEESSSWISSSTINDLYLNQESFVINSWKSGSNRLYKYNYNGVELAQLATGDGDVTAYYGCDEGGAHYYQAAAPTPMDRVVKRIDSKGRISEISPAKGTASAEFSPNMKYMILKHSTSEQPPIYTLKTSSGKNIRTIEDNGAYAAQFKDKVAKREYFTMTSGDVTLNGYIIKPSDFIASKKYPVVMYQYSGPESQQVLNRWEVDWHDAFAKAGYVVMCVDGRGTGGRGRAFCDIVHKRLGCYETIDQIAAARYAASLHFVDASRIGICGWSYGGYETLMVATADDCPFKAAVAIAPVTDWRFYDTVYAERFMLTPQQNEDGYDDASPLLRADKLACSLLLMHGTSDDNVHPANTYEFVSALQSHGLLCDMLLFPNMNHSINHCNARAVVYAKMLDWFNKNL